MNCNNCKHWGVNKNHLYAQGKTDVKRCERVPQYWDSTDWDSTGDKRIYTVESKAFVQDGSDYHAELLTKADFYCNMWEGK